ncbi:hypothetical protein [Streptomyces sp. 7-21]|uniref:hypothetical protein n=1 Tax=Streptomyces sp. 7-21 TaxID=2802283 RepID=UPI00191F28D4|nr:hypothetical protein [Streptomyces sp. 7-21]MBL1068347.1 hypothetical protein [Streptomyces sp. 7-21]
MLTLRLIRGADAPALCRRLLLAGAAGGVGFLLLASLGYALAHPGDNGAAALRLACCAVPLAATVQLAMAVTRADPVVRRRPGLTAAGLGPARVPVLACLTSALAALAGSAAALAVFVHLRGDGPAGPVGGGDAGWLAAGRPLPLAAALTLLTVVPLAAAAASALAVRPRRGAAADAARPEPALPAPRGAGPAAPPVPGPAGLPWGVALATAGVALGARAGRRPGEGLPLPGTLGEATAGVAGGWLLLAAGLVVSAPGLVHACGRAVAAGRPGAPRLLAGRTLQREAWRAGRPLGALAAATAALLAVVRLDGPGVLGGPGALGAGVVLVCAAGTVAAVAAESRAARAETAALLVRLGASRRLLRGVAALRVAALLVVFVPVVWLASALFTLAL